MTQLEKIKEAMIKGNMSIPGRYKFVLTKKEDSLSVMFSPMKHSKCKLENVKLDDTQSYFLDGTVAATLEVRDVTTHEEMLDILKKLQDKWL